jgi:hypothetical protein
MVVGEAIPASSQRPAEAFERPGEPSTSNLLRRSEMARPTLAHIATRVSSSAVVGKRNAVVMLSTVSADLGLLPMALARKQGKAIANERGCDIYLRHPVSDRVLCVLTPRSRKWLAHRRRT